VFNAGERVEGYTNFSWTLLVTLGMALGIDPQRPPTGMDWDASWRHCSCCSVRAGA
jgi:hypothetical protein